MQTADKFIILPIEKYNHLQKRLEEKDDRKEVDQPAETPKSSDDDNAPNTDPTFVQDTQPTPGKEMNSFDDGGLDRKTILSAIPKMYKGKATALLDHLPPSVTWNIKGELMINGNTLQGSHISDLLRDTQRQFRDVIPLGRDQFWEALKEANIPRCLIGNDHYFGQKTTTSHQSNVKVIKKRVKTVKRMKPKPKMKWISLWD